METRPGGGLILIIIIYMNDIISLMAANQLFSLVAHKEASGNIIGMVADKPLRKQEPNGDISAGNLLFQGGSHMVNIR